jgi:hypothetical protein
MGSLVRETYGLEVYGVCSVLYKESENIKYRQLLQVRCLVTTIFGFCLHCLGGRGFSLSPLRKQKSGLRYS